MFCLYFRRSSHRGMRRKREDEHNTVSIFTFFFFHKDISCISVIWDTKAPVHLSFSTTFKVNMVGVKFKQGCNNYVTLWLCHQWGQKNSQTRSTPFEVQCVPHYPNPRVLFHRMILSDQKPFLLYYFFFFCQASGSLQEPCI